MYSTANIEEELVFLQLTMEEMQDEFQRKLEAEKSRTRLGCQCEQ